MDKISVSVIIPTYKPKEYLWECLDSFAKQTMPCEEFEVILILNGCQAPYEEQIREYLSRRMKEVSVNFIQTNEPGVSNARNIGLENAKGEYITFVDDDDYVSDSFLSELRERATPDIVSICRPLAFIDGTTEERPYRIAHEYYRREKHGVQPFYRAKKLFSGPCMKLIHRDIISNRRFDPRFRNGEDSLFCFLISDKMQFVDFTSPNAVYFRRIRTGSAVTTNRSHIERICNRCRMIVVYCSYYFPNLKRYYFGFFATRVLAALRGML